MSEKVKIIHFKNFCYHQIFLTHLLGCSFLTTIMVFWLKSLEPDTSPAMPEE